MASFIEIYNKIYEQSKYELEIMRKKARNNYIIIICICLIVFIVSFMTYQMIGVSFVLTIILFVLLTLLFSRGNVRYKFAYKNLVIKQFFKAYDERLNYFPTRGISEKQYTDGEFEHFDRYQSEDYIEGIIKDINIRLSEVKTEEESTDSDGDTHYSTVFHGLFCIIDNPQKFQDKIYIRTDKGRFGNLLKKNRVEMDSSEFERYFEVYGRDPITIMQILTSDIMELMINFREDMKIKYEITIKDKIYIRFHCGPMFEPKVFGKTLDTDLLAKTYKIIDFVFKVSEMINKTIKELDI